MSPLVPTRILMAVDDTAEALAAARLATDLAAESGASLRFVHVVGDGALVRALGHRDGGYELAARRLDESKALLHHVGESARRAGVDAETVGLEGDPATLVLAQAHDWQADLIVLGRFDVRGPGQSYVGAVTRHVLEFSEVPVLIVPRPR